MGKKDIRSEELLCQVSAELWGINLSKARQKLTLFVLPSKNNVSLMCLRTLTFRGDTFVEDHLAWSDSPQEEASTLFPWG